MIIYDKRSEPLGIPSELTDPEKVCSIRMSFFYLWSYSNNLLLKAPSERIAKLISSGASALEIFQNLRKTRLTSDEFTYAGNGYVIKYYRNHHEKSYITDFSGWAAKKNWTLTGDMKEYESVQSILDEAYSLDLPPTLSGGQIAILRAAGLEVALAQPDERLTATTPPYQKRIVEELALVGVSITDLWSGLVTSHFRYPQAIPILTDWLENYRARTPEEYHRKFGMTLVEVLTTPDAAGLAFSALFNELRLASSDEYYQWLIFDALSRTATEKDLNVMLDLLFDESQVDYRKSIIPRYLRRSRDVRIPEFLGKALKDPVLAEEARKEMKRRNLTLKK
ncbi:hypothetical protein [Psychromicrobium lacuslunae]|uniref:Uncharacterized protein n=1 Tax=Psychromicrobium lacuslunae TaxID=1618207 RepID=A0A0D4C0F5_9MICC|nr:hypothetical protein [Psychromicrobium lacuslunae]AJT42019.1 hypothetical protein UM93_11775 [Psychromicrobium lacuslunae]